MTVIEIEVVNSRMSW